MSRKYKNITGQRFGRLVAIRQIIKEVNGKNRTYWEFKCDCGKIVTIRMDGVVKGYVKSCGCYLRDSVSARMKGGNNTSFKKGNIPHNKGISAVKWLGIDNAIKIVNRLKANPPGPERIHKLIEANKKPVIQMTKLGDIVAFHDSVNSAAKSVNRSGTAISRVCCHRGISSGGYCFIFFDEYMDRIKR